MITPTFSIGTGNSHAHLDKNEALALNNTEIDLARAHQFMDFAGIQFKPRLVFRNRRTVRRWGWADTHRGVICLYRHSVFVFLHELAHLERPNVPGTAHDRYFGLALQNLVYRWRRFVGGEIRWTIPQEPQWILAPQTVHLIPASVPMAPAPQQLPAPQSSAPVKRNKVLEKILADD